MKLTPERVQELLAAATPGPWTSERAIYSEDYLVTMDRRSEAYVTREPDAALIAAAPDLAADLLDAHAALAAGRERAEAAEAECARLRESEADAARLFESVRYQRDTARAEADALRAIVEGRTVAPTDAEIAAHAAAGRSWLCGGSGMGSARVYRTGSAFDAGMLASECRRAIAPGVRWIPLDDDDMPCAWPTTGGGL